MIELSRARYVCSTAEKLLRQAAVQWRQLHEPYLAGWWVVNALPRRIHLYKSELEVRQQVRDWRAREQSSQNYESRTMMEQHSRKKRGVIFRNTSLSTFVAAIAVLCSFKLCIVLCPDGLTI